MEKNPKVLKIIELVHERDAIDMQLAALISQEIPEPKPILTKKIKTGGRRIDPSIRSLIENDLKNGVRVLDISQKYNISEPTIYNIKTELGLSGRVVKKLESVNVTRDDEDIDDVIGLM